MNPSEDRAEPLVEALDVAGAEARVRAQAARSGGVAQLRRVLDLTASGHTADEIAEWARRQIIRLESGV